MRISALMLALAIPAAGGLNAAAQVTGLTTLETLRDRARPLLIFAPKPADAQLGIQMRTLDEHAAEVRDRDIIPIALPYNNPGPSAAQLSSTEADAVRRRFHVEPGVFTVILVGKDGGAKLRSKKPLSMDKLIETIDAMPMRQDEVKAKSGR